jgi:hypothetical protein
LRGGAAVVARGQYNTCLPPTIVALARARAPLLVHVFARTVLAGAAPGTTARVSSR